MKNFFFINVLLLFVCTLFILLLSVYEEYIHIYTRMLYQQLETSIYQVVRIHIENVKAFVAICCRETTQTMLLFLIPSMTKK
jgi:hypothetical protein